MILNAQLTKICLYIYIYIVWEFYSVSGNRTELKICLYFIVLSSIKFLGSSQETDASRSTLGQAAKL